jgi:hypothetical protein
LKLAEHLRRFRTEVSSVANERGWASSLVRIFDGDIQVGEYLRNYPSFAAETFEPFEVDGRWYALYSPDYTSTRLMSLTDCRDLGGEAPDAAGFCPVAYLVPRYRVVTKTHPDSDYTMRSAYFEADGETDLEGKWDSWRDVRVGAWQSFPVGFVAGCFWGVDNTRKLQTIDLTRVSEGVIARREAFGHLELSGPLDSSIDIHLSDNGAWRARIKRQQHWDPLSGELLDPYDL